MWCLILKKAVIFKTCSKSKYIFWYDFKYISINIIMAETSVKLNHYIVSSAVLHIISNVL